jgi:hypothetical protein
MKIAELWPTLSDSLIPYMGICTTFSTRFNVESNTPSTSFQKIMAIPTCSPFFNVARETDVSVISAAITSNHVFFAYSIASGVWPNCLNPTLVSAPSDVFATFCVSSGDGVYPVSRTCHHNASAVRIMFPTL